jgi:hypothetical protein
MLAEILVHRLNHARYGKVTERTLQQHVLNREHRF